MNRPQVYFIECSGRIKIGFSSNVQARLRQFSTGSALKFSLVAAIDGSKWLEKTIHREMAAHRHHGEWFDDCPTVRALIQRLVVDGPSSIGFCEAEPVAVKKPRVKRSAASVRITSDYVPSPIVFDPIFLRIGACAQRYFGPVSAYPTSVKRDKADDGFALLDLAVERLKTIVGDPDEPDSPISKFPLEDLLPAAADAIAEMEFGLERLFAGAPTEARSECRP